MTTSQIESEGFVHLDKQYYYERVNDLCNPFFLQFSRVIRNFLIFNITFLSLACIEVVVFFLFFTFLAKSAVLAFSLALIFLTGFSYAVLRIYFQNKKPEQLAELRNAFIEECKRLLNYQEPILDHHLALSNAVCKLASSLCGKEFQCYKLPRKLQFLAPILQKLSCWCYWQDLLKMKEILLITAVDEHFKMIEAEPTNLEVHASLANVYVMLSNIYSDPRKQEGFDDDLWIPSGRLSAEMQQKFRSTAERAIEEFKILKDYAPDDPWVHVQLAYSYHDLQMPREEIFEYETLLRLQPDDQETLFKLGVLYFEQGFNAKGLQMYETLKQTHYKKAQNLMKFYGAYSPSNEDVKRYG